MAINPSSAIGAMNSATSMQGLNSMQGLDSLSNAGAGAYAAPAGLDGATPLAGPLPAGGTLDFSPSGEPGGASFESALSFIDKAAAKEGEATRLQTAFAQGKDVPLHQVMAASEEASIALETLAALRDRVLDAVNELTKMQI